MTTVGSGKHTYEMHEQWAHLPQGWEMPAAAVAVDKQDRVFCFNRSPHHPVVIFDRDGNFLSSWGEGMFTFPHAITFDGAGHVWLVDRNVGQVMKFTPEGKLLLTIGKRGYMSDTGNTVVSSDGYQNVTHPGEPFNLPAGIAVAPSGDIFIADGYGNCRVHRFAPDGKLRFSWGQPGSGPGQFVLPHGVLIDRRGHVLVADRQNDRVQVFTQDGKFVSVWPTEFIGPAVFATDEDDTVYIAEHNGGYTSIVTRDGERLARWGSLVHRSAHGIAVDSQGDMYVVQPPERSEGGSRNRIVTKFIRR